MGSTISEAALHAFHFSRLIPSSSSSSTRTNLDRPPLEHSLTLDTLRFRAVTFHDADSARCPISEAEVHAFHLSTLSHLPTKPRRSLPTKTRPKLTRPVHRYLSVSPFSIIPLSSPSSSHAHIPLQALSPENHRRDSASLPFLADKDNIGDSGTDSDDEVNQLRSSSLPVQDREGGWGTWREGSSNTSASSMIPSSPLPFAVRDKEGGSGRMRVKPLGMVGMGGVGRERIRTPRSIVEVENGRVGGSAGRKSGKMRKGPTWVTSTPVASFAGT